MAASCTLVGLPEDVLIPLRHLAAHLGHQPLAITDDGSRTSLVEWSVLQRALEGLDFTTIPGVGAGTSGQAALAALVDCAVRANPEVDRAVGAVVGNALADALGHPLEFIPVDDAPPPFPEDRPHLDAVVLTDDGEPVYHSALNRFALKPGQWTDDFSMAACLADSLLVCGRYDGRDARIRWHNWWNHGYNNAFRFDRGRRFLGRGSVGLGGNICNSLHDLENYAGCEERIPPLYGASGEDAGNGSIMRLSPVPVMYHADLAQAEAMAARQSRGTHPGCDAAASCQFMAFFIVTAIRSGLAAGQSTKQFVDAVVSEFVRTHDMAQDSGYRNLWRVLRGEEPPESKECCWNWRMSRLPISAALKNRRAERTYNGYPISAGYFGSYCLDGLAMALWGVYHTTTFDQAVISVVNLLGDADSTGAVAGQLAGALYGYQGIKAGTPANVRHEGRCEIDAAGNMVPTAPAFPTVGACWLHHLLRWDPFSEIPLRAVLLYALQPLPEEAAADDEEKSTEESGGKRHCTRPPRRRVVADDDESEG